MNTYTVHVFATCTVTARDEEHAREILHAISRNGAEITLTGCKHKDTGSIFMLGTINPEAELKFCYKE